VPGGANYGSEIRCIPVARRGDGPRPGFRTIREGGTGVEGYCVKCRAKKEIKNAKQVTMKNGRPATEGQCPDCGTKIFKIGKAS
jgi:hypothetical protein